MRDAVDNLHNKKVSDNNLNHNTLTNIRVVKVQIKNTDIPVWTKDT